MKNKKLTKILLIILIPILIVLVALIAIINSPSDTETTTDSSQLTVRYGELLSTKEGTTDDGGPRVVVKTKITSSYDNAATVRQNYYNVADLIRNKGFNKYDEIQYWAVADMTSGDESKVVAFTLDKESIEKIYNEQVLDDNIGEIADDLFIHSSLRSDK